MKRKWFPLFLALALFLKACGNQPASEATPTPFPTPVRATFTVQRGDITVEAKLSGRVEPLALQTVYFQINGQVREVYTNVNDVVKQGQLLGELAVVDAAGRLQIPREYLEQFNIRRRVQVELTDHGILIRPPEKEHPSHDQTLAASSGEPESTVSGVQDSAIVLKAWQSLKSRFTSKRHNGDGK